MTADLKHVMAYLIKHYPSDLRDELSNARLTQMVYLGDWHQAINFGRQITNIDWDFESYGPHVRDINETASRHADIFSVQESTNIAGSSERVYSLRDKGFEPRLDKQARESLGHIIEVTKKLNGADFIKLVYSTYPVFSSERYSRLNLVEKAKEYRAETEQAEALRQS